jgi:hypothetical protein
MFPLWVWAGMGLQKRQQRSRIPKHPKFLPEEIGTIVPVRISARRYTAPRRSIEVAKRNANRC